MMNDSRPAILLADMTSWETFIHLAGALRSRGVRVVRVTGRQHSLTQRGRVGLERAVFDRTEAVLRDPDESAISALLPWLRQVADVQMVDAIGASVTGSAAWEQQVHLHRCSGLPDTVLYDKVAYSRVALAAGVPVSELAALDQELPAGQLLLKARVGSGGQFVKLIDSEDDIDRALQVWGLAPAQVFLQRAVHGQPWAVGGVARRGEVLVSASYETLGSPDDPYGPAVHIRIEPHPEALRVAQLVVGALDYSGPFAMDFIDDGIPHLIDFNPRFFGSWALLQAAGVDLLGAYLATLGMSWSGPGPQVRTSWQRVSTRGQPGVAGAWRRTRDLTSALHPVIGTRATAVIGVESLMGSVRA